MAIRIKQIGNVFTYETGPAVTTPIAVGGTNGAVQFNDGDTFGGDSNFTFNKATDTLSVSNLSGSLTRLSSGNSYLVAGNNVTITSASNGQITISSSAPGGSGADVNAQYLVLSATGSLSAERVLTTGAGLSSTDGGSGGNYTLAIDNSIVATVSGTTFTGATKHNAGLSGSLTRLTDNTSAFIAGTGISIVSSSNGAVTISTLGSGGDVIGPSLATDNGIARFDTTTGKLIQSSSITITDTDDMTIPGQLLTTGEATFISPVDMQSDLVVSGSAEVQVDLTTLGNSTTLGDSFVTNNSTVGASLYVSGSAEVAGSLLLLSDAFVSTDISVLGDAGVEGNVYTSVVTASMGFSGSLTRLSNGASYLVAGTNVTITSASNGAVTISASGGGTPAGSNTEIQFNNAGSFGASANLNFNSSTNTLSLTGSFGIQGSIIPNSDSAYTLGTADKRWAHVYTGDLHLRNDRGDWTIIEEKDYLCVVNNITGKKYKMMLQPLD